MAVSKLRLAVASVLLACATGAHAQSPAPAALPKGLQALSPAERATTCVVLLTDMATAALDATGSEPKAREEAAELLAIATVWEGRSGRLQDRARVDKAVTTQAWEETTAQMDYCIDDGNAQLMKLADDAQRKAHDEGRRRGDAILSNMPKK